MMKRILLLSVALLIHGCANHTKLAQESVEERLLSPGKLTYRNVESYPGKVVCGEYSPNRKALDSTFKPFIYVSSGLIMPPSEEDQAIFCSQDGRQALYDTTGIDFSGESKTTLLIISRDYQQLAIALEQYLSDNLWLPSSRQGLDALLHPTETPPKPRKFKDGGYIKEIPTDPWEKPYIYTGPAFAGVQGTYKLLTLGADGKPGGTGEDTDIEWQHMKYIDHIDKLNWYWLLHEKYICIQELHDN